MHIESEYQSVLTQIEDLLGKKDEAGMPESCGMNELGSMIEKTTVCHNKIGDFVAKLSGVCEPDPECEEEELDWLLGGTKKKIADLNETAKKKL